MVHALIVGGSHFDGGGCPGRRFNQVGRYRAGGQQVPGFNVVKLCSADGDHSAQDKGQGNPVISQAGGGNRGGIGAYGDLDQENIVASSGNRDRHAHSRTCAGSGVDIGEGHGALGPGPMGLRKEGQE